MVVLLFIVAMMIAFRYVRERSDRFGDVDQSIALEESRDSRSALSPRFRERGSGGEAASLSKTEPNLARKTGGKGAIDLETSDAGNDSILPADRPDWVAAPDNFTDNVHQIGIAGDLEDSAEAARRKFDAALVEGVRGYIQRCIVEQWLEQEASPWTSKGNEIEMASLANRVKQLPIAADWIRKNLADKAPEYEAVMERPSGTYYQLWTRLSVDAEDRKVMVSWVKNLEIRHRVGLLGAGVFGLLVLMTILHGLLRILTPAETEA